MCCPGVVLVTIPVPNRAVWLLGSWACCPPCSAGDSFSHVCIWLLMQQVFIWCAVHGVTQSRTQLKRPSNSSSSRTHVAWFWTQETTRCINTLLPPRVSTGKWRGCFRISALMRLCPHCGPQRVLVQGGGSGGDVKDLVDQ